MKMMGHEEGCSEIPLFYLAVKFTFFNRKTGCAFRHSKNVRFVLLEGRLCPTELSEEALKMKEYPGGSWPPV
jgi:hypothetical protein